MIITFFSTYLNHHQFPLCQAFFRLTEGQFYYVSTSKISEERLRLGYTNMDYDYPYVIRAYESNENKITAQKLAIESDVVIFGHCPETYVQLRMKTNRLSFRYCERIYKTGLWKIFSPRGFAYLYKNHSQYHNKNMYLLCAGAYTAFDYSLVGAYKGKTFKWGYFPEIKKVNVNALVQRKRENKSIRILWVGRFVEYKHPEMAIEIAAMLKNSGYSFELDIIGGGEKIQMINKLIKNKKLEKYVHMLGTMSPETVRTHMEESNIFLLTSDFGEGWGAVLNEAMNSACAIVASHAVGSVPYLLRSGENGFIYKNRDLHDLYEKVALLIKQRTIREKMGMNAYKTVNTLWNAEVAAKRFVELSQDIIHGKNNTSAFSDGPCSKAEIMPNWWYKYNDRL